MSNALHPTNAPGQGSSRVLLIQRITRLLLSPAMYFAVALILSMPAPVTFIFTRVVAIIPSFQDNNLTWIALLIFSAWQRIIFGAALLVGILLFLMRDLITEFWPTMRPWIFREGCKQESTTAPQKRRRLTRLLRSPITYGCAFFTLYAIELIVRFFAPGYPDVPNAIPPILPNLADIVDYPAESILLLLPWLSVLRQACILGGGLTLILRTRLAPIGRQDSARRRVAWIKAIVGFCIVASLGYYVVASMNYEPWVELRASIVNGTDEEIRDLHVENCKVGSARPGHWASEFLCQIKVPRKWEPKYRVFITWRTASSGKNGSPFETYADISRYDKFKSGETGVLWVTIFPDSPPAVFVGRLEEESGETVP